MQPFTKREITIAVISLLLILAIGVGSGVYITNLQQAQAVRNQNNSRSLAEQNEQLNALDNYNTTICAEYRKLYKAYKEASLRAPSADGTGYALPGSAKGNVDECYQPE